MNKEGEKLFFARPPSDDDEIYCPYCGSAYKARCTFECGLTITQQKAVFAQEGKEIGFNCKVYNSCPIKVEEMTENQMKARIQTMLQLPSVARMDS